MYVYLDPSESHNVPSESHKHCGMSVRSGGIVESARQHRPVVLLEVGGRPIDGLCGTCTVYDNPLDFITLQQDLYIEQREDKTQMVVVRGRKTNSAKSN